MRNNKLVRITIWVVVIGMVMSLLFSVIGLLT
jgi:preprotein translocase subunit SecE